MTKFRVFWIVLLTGLFFGCSETKQRPNILFCIADDATWKHMSAYGNSWAQTPAFDQVAEQGILFTNAYTPNAKCAPSRAIVLTGRNSWQLEEAANHLPFFPTKFKTYPEALAESGYWVGFTGKGWAPGTSLNEQGEKRELLVRAFNNYNFDSVPASGISKKDYASNFRDFLDSRKADEPFCFWYGSHEPHRSYEYGSGVKYGNKSTSDIDDVFAYWPDNDTTRNDMLDYAFELEYFDTQLGEMLRILEERGELDNTVVVVTSDNGMPFPRIKGQQYEHSHHLPLAVMWPKGIAKPGRTVSQYVSFTDFAATFLGLAGITVEEAGMEPLEGKSLADYFKSNESPNKREFILLGKERHDLGRPKDVGYPIRGIVKGDFLYLRNFKTDRWPAGNPETGYTNTDGSPTKSYILNMRRNGVDTLYWEQNFGKRTSEELYNISEDEDCIINLAENPDYESVKKQLSDLMESELKKQNDPRILGNGDIFDNYPPHKDAGFYERYMSGEKVNAGWINKSDFEKNEPNH